MNAFLPQMKEVRSDLSEWLIHFTKGSHSQGRETLDAIRLDGKLKSFRAPAISFSEAPLVELNKL